MTDFSIPAPGMTAWEIDHLADPRDDAEALVELLELRVAEATPRVCDDCGERPCACVHAATHLGSRKCCDCGSIFDRKTENQIRCPWCLVAKHDVEMP